MRNAVIKHSRKHQDRFYKMAVFEFSFFVKPAEDLAIMYKALIFIF